MASTIKNNGNILYYINDPNDVNINTNLTNGISQYQDMHIFAELTANRKGRSVIVVGQGLKSEDRVTVNFMANNIVG